MKMRIVSHQSVVSLKNHFIAIAFLSILQNVLRTDFPQADSLSPAFASVRKIAIVCIRLWGLRLQTRDENLPKEKTYFLPNKLQVRGRLCSAYAHNYYITVAPNVTQYVRSRIQNLFVDVVALWNWLSFSNIQYVQQFIKTIGIEFFKINVQFFFLDINLGKRSNYSYITTAATSLIYFQQTCFSE